MLTRKDKIMDEKKIGANKPEFEEEVIIGTPYKVLLFNDDIHSFEEVILQLVKAIGCSFEEARDYAFEAHVKGKAAVFRGELSKCLAVSSVLEEIALHTQIVS